MTGESWQFWIDVGGTFTDCLARRPDGKLLRHKLLSSGVTKGRAGAGSSANCFVDSARRLDPADFWIGFGLRLLDERGDVVGESMVERFDRTSGSLWTREEVPGFTGDGQWYELVGQEEAPRQAIRYLLGLAPQSPLPPVMMKLGTTKGTNALLTRQGAACAFVTTRGFADILLIGYQNRPRLFELTIRKPAPLFAATAEIDERLAADGKVLRAPDRSQIEQSLGELFARGIRSLAICLLHAYRYPEHERIVEEVARKIGFTEISRSSEVAPFIKLVSRGDTTVVDAYLNPILRSYVARLSRVSSPDPLTVRLLTSAGGLVAGDQFHGKDSILSGPAGGVVGFSRVAGSAGFGRAIGFDMGGTSTDVSRFDGSYDLEFETEKAGVRIVAPMLAIETVAAGGGSICWFDGVKLCVGPDSAGSEPGPACYGRGGPLAVTDVNLFLGRLPVDYFPFQLDRLAVERRLGELRDAVARETGQALDRVDVAEGLLRVANTKMAKAIRSISVAKGYDPREYVLVPFGGAAGQHACAIADELGMSQVLCHPDAGLLSAYGIGLADVTRFRAQGVYLPDSDRTRDELRRLFARLATEAIQEVVAEGVAEERVTVQRSLDMRYHGTDVPLHINEPPDGDYARAFADEHERMYGYAHHDRAVEIVAARVEATGAAWEQLLPSRRTVARACPATSTTQAVFQRMERSIALYRRDELEAGDHLTGPAIVLDRTSTTVIDPGWQAEMLTGRELLLTRTADAVGGGRKPLNAAATQAGDRTTEQLAADPVTLEVFHNHFAAIAEQMGITLRNTSSSVNVKERLDFSCALFTAAGDLVVNAPHIPVHLGAMGETVRRVVADNPDLQSGDVLVTNDPYRGGSHLPDITVVTPVFQPATRQLMFFTASRAHHAEIGGMTPGSMPPFSRRLSDEGVLIRNFKLVAAGQSRIQEFRTLLESGDYPSRRVEDNLYDCSAQVAANQQGCRDLLGLVERYGWPQVSGYMGHIQAAAEQKMRRALQRLPDGEYPFVDHLDDGSRIAVCVTIAGDSAVIDFTGTSAVLPGNLNANRAIVTAAVMYCLRCLIDEEIPLNQGVLSPVKLVLPECLLNPPEQATSQRCAAVAGGNVETSQRVVDVVLGALRLAAASQGTMNNLLFGDGTFGYYETICGGAGATQEAPGADAVHTHMTNTRLTDPEILEHRYPVRLQEFALRRGSGGSGRHPGGNGVVRRIEFLRDLELSILSQRRGEKYLPYGLAGGGSGAAGRNTLLRADGTKEELPGITRCDVHAGDQLRIETPGGGGWG